MHLYKNKCFILLFLRIALCISNNELKVSRKGLRDLSHCSIGLQFLVEVNNTSTNNDFEVELKPDECCLVADGNVDCDSLEIVGASHGIVPRDSTKSFRLIAPLLDPYQRRGYCTVFLDSSPNRAKHIMRDRVNINFNTFLKDYEDSDIKRCKRTDQDPLNNCKPVDCETFYNDNKSHYCKKLHKCVKVPRCIANSNMKYPEIIYNPVLNECIDNFITNRDINDIKTLNKRSNNRIPKDIVIIRNNYDHDTDVIKYNDTYSDSIYDMPPDPTVDEIPPPPKSNKAKDSCLIPKKIKKPGKKARFFGIKHISRWALLGLLIIIFVQCCIICSLIYCLIQRYTFWKKKKDVVNTYYNYRHDASVTTPLIDNSNIDTNTDGPHYPSESSTNLDNKAKHYKSIQKDGNDTVKKSLSDDILSKCINRRNWIRNTKFESAPNNSINTSNLRKEEILGEIKNLNDKPHTQYQTNFTMKDSNESRNTKINFESEDSKANLLKTVSSLKQSIVKKSFENHFSSEKEIKCTSYSNAQSNKSSLLLKKQSPKTVGYFQIDNNYDPPSIEKSAQAYFSNDSIDDFISERGMIFFAGDDTSKYTLSSESMPINPSSCSGISNKTSKNNIVSNVLSLLRMRSKHGPNSDPGVKSNDKSLDVQLLHISTNSVYSSSNNEMEALVNCRNFVNESRTSL